MASCFQRAYIEASIALSRSIVERVSHLLELPSGLPVASHDGALWSIASGLPGSKPLATDHAPVDGSSAKVGGDADTGAGAGGKRSQQAPSLVKGQVLLTECKPSPKMRTSGLSPPRILA